MSGEEPGSDQDVYGVESRVIADCRQGRFLYLGLVGSTKWNGLGRLNKG